MFQDELRSQTSSSGGGRWSCAWSVKTRRHKALASAGVTGHVMARHAVTTKLRCKHLLPSVLIPLLIYPPPPHHLFLVPTFPRFFLSSLSHLIPFLIRSDIKFPQFQPRFPICALHLFLNESTQPKLILNDCYWCVCSLKSTLYASYFVNLWLIIRLFFFIFLSI